MAEIDLIKQLNRDSGRHFFDESTMRWFDSKVYGKVFGDYFVTSERSPWAGSRRYSVRRVNRNTGEVSTVGEFQQFFTLQEAYRAAKKYSEG